MFQGIRLMLVLAFSLILVQSVPAQDDPPIAEPLTFPVFRMNPVSAAPGENVTVNIQLENTIPISGFDVMIMFDERCLTFLTAEQMGPLSGWEYFTYRYGIYDTCGGSCPLGQLRLVGRAETANFQPEGVIIELTFHVPERVASFCECVDLNWAWLDCADNAMSSIGLDTLFLAYNIEHMLPGQDCMQPPVDPVPIPITRFMNGQICINVGCEREGDCNNDNNIDVVDIVYLIDYLLRDGRAPVEGCGCDSFCRADFNCDGGLNLADITALIRYVLRQPSSRPCAR